MLFNSYPYIFIFLPLTFVVYFYLLRLRLVIGAKGFLVFASLFFYSWWNLAYLPIILSSLLFNYVIGSTLGDNRHPARLPRKALLVIGISGNIALLGYFKYVDFLVENLNLLLDMHIGMLNLILPLAISFFTFQQITYLIDSYRGETKEYDFLNYSLFVTFFPQLIAGPIVHHSEMMPQFASRWSLLRRDRNVAAGLFVFSIGLFKKVIIADTFAVWAMAGFDRAESLNLIEAWVTSLSYTFQLYFDFSGYTDMAVGAALLFNIYLPQNFNSPYKARNIQEFWRRWHMTLSRFLRDYIYIPLGGSRQGELRTYRNLMVTFLLGGLWHGAGWTFLFWGLLHGIALIVVQIWGRIGIRLPMILAWFITFNFVNIAWVFFRAKEWNDAIKVLGGMFGGSLVIDYNLRDKVWYLHDGIQFGAWLQNIYADNTVFGWMLLAFLITFAMKNSTELLSGFGRSHTTLWFSTLLVTFSLLDMNKVSEFLYFNF